MNYTETGRTTGGFRRSRSRELEQTHEPQRERDTFNNDRKKKGNVRPLYPQPYSNYAFRARFPAYMGRGARGGMMGMSGYKPFGTPGYAQPGPYFPPMGPGFIPDAVDGKLMGAYWNTLEKEDKDCETFADLFINAERAYASSLIRPDEVGIGPIIMRDLRFKLNCKPLQGKDKKEPKRDSKSKIAEVLQELDALFYSQD